jgi:TetR/AcrR family transcriptional regulator
MAKADSGTRARILRAALKIFADCGYAAASVQAIVDAARVTKPMLYYYFHSKAELFQALIDLAHDERFRLMQEAAGRSRNVAGRLVETWTSLFEFIDGHRELMRLAFATAFAARGEIPAGIRYLEKGRRNFELVVGLMREGRTAGELDSRHSSRELALALWGMMNIRVMDYLVQRRRRLTRRDAERVVRLFLNGAAHGRRM